MITRLAFGDYSTVEILKRCLLGQKQFFLVFTILYAIYPQSREIKTVFFITALWVVYCLKQQWKHSPGAGREKKVVVIAMLTKQTMAIVVRARRGVTRISKRRGSVMETRRMQVIATSMYLEMFSRLTDVMSSNSHISHESIRAHLKCLELYFEMY